jgi:hypothetical protein
MDGPAFCVREKVTCFTDAGSIHEPGRRERGRIPEIGKAKDRESTPGDEREHVPPRF